MASNISQTRFVTAMSYVGYQEYGRRFLTQFEKRGNGHKLVVYGRRQIPEVPDNVELRLKDHIPGLDPTISTLRKDPFACGKAEAFGHKWKDKELKDGYSYRFDAHKFCRMAIVTGHAAVRLKAEGVRYMIWVDADMSVRQQIPDDIAERALEGKDYAYLGRPGKYTETGFLVFDLKRSVPVAKRWADFYLKGNFKYEKEWHSAWLFDRARECYPDIVGNNLTPKGRGHVIHQCWVGKILDHLKGNRKKAGRSREAR